MTYICALLVELLLHFPGNITAAASITWQTVWISWIITRDPYKQLLENFCCLFFLSLWNELDLLCLLGGFNLRKPAVMTSCMTLSVSLNFGRLPLGWGFCADVTCLFLQTLWCALGPELSALVWSVQRTEVLSFVQIWAKSLNNLISNGSMFDRNALVSKSWSETSKRKKRLKRI